MSKLISGFARTGINPPLGCGLSGYFVPRYVDGYLDDLRLDMLALEVNGTRVLIVSSDTVKIPSNLSDRVRKVAAEAANTVPDAVFFAATHTHTGPFLDLTDETAPADLPVDITNAYIEQYVAAVKECASRAVADMRPTEMRLAETRAEGMSFIRTYKMKDGSVHTNPGFNNPDVLEPVGELDDSVGVLVFERSDGEKYFLVNFACHPDTVGGTKTSADWPGFMRRRIEEKTGAKCLYLNGAEGDVNHISSFPDAEYLSRVTVDFDDVPRGYEYTKYMGEKIADAVLAVAGDAEEIPVEKIKFAYKTVDVPTNMPSPDELPEAHRINDLYLSGRDCELPYERMMLTTIVAEAGRMVKLEHGPESIPMPLTAISLGDVALLGIPGEPFSKIGIELKKAAGVRALFPCCLTNGDIGYFPMRDAYERGGYEARSSLFRAGVGELIVDEGAKILREM